MENRGQSALEYLMTYGWALVVIVIAVAALVVLINPSQLQGNRCDAKIGPFALGAESSVLSDRINLVLTNTLGVAVTDMDFTMVNKGDTIYGGSSGACINESLAVNETKGIGCTYDAGKTVSGAYDVTLSLKYGTPNVGPSGNSALRPTVTAHCTGSI